MSLAVISLVSCRNVGLLAPQHPQGVDRIHDTTGSFTPTLGQFPYRHVGVVKLVYHLDELLEWSSHLSPSLKPFSAIHTSISWYRSFNRWTTCSSRGMRSVSSMAITWLMWNSCAIPLACLLTSSWAFVSGLFRCRRSDRLSITFRSSKVVPIRLSRYAASRSGCQCYKLARLLNGNPTSSASTMHRVRSHRERSVPRPTFRAIASASMARRSLYCFVRTSMS